MHLPPTVWGPFFWHTMHIVAIGYSKHPTYTDKKCAKEFFESLVFLIPCSVCREHYKEHLTNKPITPFLDSREDLLKWTIDIHNKVNVVTNKPQWTEQEVMKYYEKLGQRTRSPIWTKQDMDEVDNRSFIRGFLSGALVLSVCSSSMFGCSMFPFFPSLNT
jgi:hypothetical protein